VINGSHIENFTLTQTWNVLCLSVLCFVVLSLLDIVQSIYEIVSSVLNMPACMFLHCVIQCVHRYTIQIL
jgi:hypothetical protein